MSWILISTHRFSCDKMSKMSKISTTYRLSCDKIDIIHEFSHDRIDNEIYYSDLSHKLIIKRRKIIII